jgi:alpha-tubulin suppressor-like RCC1 family protein
MACWGFGSQGLIGNGQTADALTPTAPTGVTNVAAIAMGDAHACALKMDGSAMCWGFNGLGQLGDGTTTNRTTPAPVTGLTNGSAIASGAMHVCVIRKTGDVVCWGENATNALGDGTTTNRTTPVPASAVAGLTTNAAAISANHGQTNCVLTTAATEICWGTPGSS